MNGLNNLKRNNNINKLFKKSGKSKIELDNNFYLTADSASNGVRLTFHEPRIREKKDGSGSEEFIFEDKWWFNTVAQSLSKYVELTEKSSSTIEEILENSEKTRKAMEEFTKTFKDY